MLRQLLCSHFGVRLNVGGGGFYRKSGVFLADLYLLASLIFLAIFRLQWPVLLLASILWIVALVFYWRMNRKIYILGLMVHCIFFSFLLPLDSSYWMHGLFAGFVSLALVWLSFERGKSILSSMLPLAFSVYCLLHFLLPAWPVHFLENIQSGIFSVLPYASNEMIDPGFGISKANLSYVSMFDSLGAISIVLWIPLLVRSWWRGSTFFLLFFLMTGFFYSEVYTENLPLWLNVSLVWASFACLPGKPYGHGFRLSILSAVLTFCILFAFRFLLDIPIAPILFPLGHFFIESTLRTIFLDYRVDRNEPIVGYSYSR